MVMVLGTFGFVPHLNFCHKCIVHSLMYQDSKYRGRVSDRNVKTKRRKEPVGGDASLPCVAELARHTAGHLRGSFPTQDGYKESYREVEVSRGEDEEGSVAAKLKTEAFHC